jgi:hypothetical protein
LRRQARGRGPEGDPYEKGQGAPQDYVLAHMWFNVGASRADPGAVESRDRVAATMTPAQIAEAQRLAGEWTQTHPPAP